MTSKTSNTPNKVLTLNELVANPSANEVIKDNSELLRGTILEDLANDVTANISADNSQLTKFHGTYIQDDRDERLTRQQKKLEPSWSFMTRVRIPGGLLSAKQWQAMDDIANKFAGEKLKLTTRQAIQFHGIIKFELAASMQAIYKASMDSIAACGDVNRNVMCSSIPVGNSIHNQTLEWATHISEHLLPSTNAWFDIWINGKKASIEELQKEEEPIYGKHYLPRKFKIAIAIPPLNDTDIFANDIGLVAIEKDNKLLGFNVCAGGGLGTTHSDNATYPRLATQIGFCKPEQILQVCEQIMMIQRDYGNRSERKNARFKYTMDRVGVDWFKEELHRRCGFKLSTIKPYTFRHNGDPLGWSEDADKKSYLVLYVENGRVFDTKDSRLKSALREIANLNICDFRLTGNQNIALGNIKKADKKKIEEIFKQANYPIECSDFSGMRKHAIACVALPTCALAMAEAQRYLPDLITKIEPILQKNGLFNEDINIRMTGCPNGCGRPWLGEIAFIGKSLGRYNMYLGAAFDGSRLNALYKENLNEQTILEELEVIIGNYAKKRKKDEKFGDFVIRSGVIKEFQAPVPI
jgi:sulfite reductase (NADPH) hemoprotein beta-component